MWLSIIEKVREFLMINLLALDDDLTIGDDDNIFESGFVDSSFAMQLITYIEEAFGITVMDEDLDLKNFSTISRIVRFVEKKING
jgi:acyl carrier protein